MKNIQQISSTKLYMIRTKENASLIDAELDRRNREVGKKFYGRKPSQQVTPEYDVWYIEDDGTILTGEAALNKLCGV